MRCRGAISAVSIVALVLLGRPAPGETTFFVASNGNDAWSGRFAEPNAAKTDGPLATLVRARDAIRKIKKADAIGEGGATVFVRGGRYELPETLKLAQEDSGTEAAPVVYRALGNEKPVLIGGKRITGFVSHKGSVLKADLGTQGFPGVYFRQLFFNGQRQILARWPNFDPANPYAGGYAYVDGRPVSMYKDLPNESLRVIQLRQGDARTWAHPEEGEVCVFPRYNWHNWMIRIASVDREKRTITLAKDAFKGIRPLDRFYVRNLPEELDAPGEWYLDRRTSTLYFWPPGPVERATVYAPTAENLVEVGSGAAWITIRGFTFECCEASAVRLVKAENCLVAGNTIHGTGGRLGDSAGVTVDGGHNCGVVGNDIFDVSNGGISLRGGDPNSLTPGGHYADNNYIHHIGVINGHGCGIWLNGIALRASHNLIHDTTRCGIFGGGCDCVVEYNHIRHTNVETEDTGAYYNGASWHVRGQVVRYNFIHDVLGYGRKDDKWVSPYFGWGIYLDDDQSGTHVYGNVVARTYLGGAHIHAGRDNLLENNIFIEGKMQQVQYSGHDPKSEVVADHLKQFKKFQHNPAYAKYPELARMDLRTAWRMTGNKFLRNIVYYRNPQARLYQYSRNDFPDENLADYNLIWHCGRTPWTGAHAAKNEHGPNLIANAGFEEGRLATLPAPWIWSLKPTGQAQAGVVDDCGHTGSRSLRVDPGPAYAPVAWMNTARIEARMVFRPGATYRFAAWIKSQREGAVAQLVAFSFKRDGHNWQSARLLHCGPQWRLCELVLKLPAPGDLEYKPTMKEFFFRIDLATDCGSFWVDDVTLREAEALDQWESWKTTGQDVHSRLADPLFVDPEKDDYRLCPDSPAFKLGFKPIPLEKIGPYRDELRASWPIREAPGVRERPLPAETPVCVSASVK